jgi:hypothetical protein
MVQNVNAETYSTVGRSPPRLSPTMGKVAGLSESAHYGGRHFGALIPMSPVAGHRLDGRSGARASESEGVVGTMEPQRRGFGAASSKRMRGLTGATDFSLSVAVAST